MINACHLAFWNQLLEHRQPYSQPAAEVDDAGGRAGGRENHRPDAACATRRFTHNCAVKFAAIVVREAR